MDIVLIIIGTLIGIALLALPVVLSVWLWKKGKIGKGLTVAFILFLAFEIYRSIYPLDEFYKEEFTKITKLPFPESGEILEKFASYPDMHGDYESCALIEVSDQDYLLLSESIQESKEFDKSHVMCSESWVSKDFYKVSQFSKEGGQVAIWGLVKNSNRVVISYVSW